MKTIAKYSALLIFLGLAQLTNAQRVMNDPSYSIHNYKHPNKAAYVKKQEDAKPVVYVEEVKDGSASTQEENSLTSSGNYKGMSARKSKTKKFAASNSPSAIPYHLAPANSNGNYKQQFPSRPRKEKDQKEEKDSETPIANN